MYVPYVKKGIPSIVSKSHKKYNVLLTDCNESSTNAPVPGLLYHLRVQQKMITWDCKLCCHEVHSNLNKITQ